MLLDQLVCGLKQCIRLHLLSQCKTLTLEIDIAQTMESAIKQSSLKISTQGVEEHREHSQCSK